MVEESKVKAKLTDKQLKQLKTAVKDKARTTLRMFKNVGWKWSTSWIIINNKTKSEAKKCIQ